MLTAFQVQTVAYTPEDFSGDNALCPGCFEEVVPGISETETYGDEAEKAAEHGYNRLDRYSADESFSCFGLDCSACGHPIIEPDHSWLEAGETCPECETPGPGEGPEDGPEFIGPTPGIDVSLGPEPELAETVEQTLGEVFASIDQRLAEQNNGEAFVMCEARGRDHEFVTVTRPSGFTYRQCRRCPVTS